MVFDYSFTIRDYSVEIEAGADQNRIITATDKKWILPQTPLTS